MDDNQCPSKSLEEMNKKIYERNIPSNQLQPYLDVRPVMTKYSYLPIVDPRREINTKMEDLPNYNIQKTFNPGNRQAPWSGFSSNINVESELRNQIYALQKCSQSVYVPNSQSDLYKHTFKTKSTDMSNHHLLFKEETFGNFDPNPDNKMIGYGLFNNSTRSQLKDLSSCD
jgi:hypothetical protein